MVGGAMGALVRDMLIGRKWQCALGSLCLWVEAVMLNAVIWASLRRTEDPVRGNGGRVFV